jgi:hypothetical protein
MVVFNRETPDPNQGGTYGLGEIDGQKAAVFFSTEVLQDSDTYGVSGEELTEFCKGNGQIKNGVLQIRIMTGDLRHYMEQGGNPA